jgi:hypothetical protein
VEFEVCGFLFGGGGEGGGVGDYLFCAVAVDYFVGDCGGGDNDLKKRGVSVLGAEVYGKEVIVMVLLSRILDGDGRR